jgi:hypothetical protein
MNGKVTALMIATGLLLQGCNAAHLTTGEAPTDISKVKIEASKQTIEEALGPSIASRQEGEMAVDVYKYNVGVEGNSLVPLLLPIAFVVAPSQLIAAERCYADDECDMGIEQDIARAERGLAVVYDPNDKAVAVIKDSTAN